MRRFLLGILAFSSLILGFSFSWDVGSRASQCPTSRLSAAGKQNDEQSRLRENPAPAENKPHKEGLASEACADCHTEILTHYPSLSELRAGWTKFTSGRLPQELRKAQCSDCHEPKDYLAQSIKREHRVRSPGDHLDCLACHSSEDASPLKNVWSGKDYQAKFCFSCHPETKQKFAFALGHDLTTGRLTCAKCHLPHSPLLAVIPLEMVPLEVRKRSTPAPKDSVCFDCHGEIAFAISGSGFALGGINLHARHSDRGVVCVECHNPHGGTRDHLIRESLISGEPFFYQSYGDGAGTCTLTCHGVNHASTSYRASPTTLMSF